MKEKLKFIFTLIILLSTYIFICAYSYVNAVSENLSNNVFRLHVLANSDSQEDQNLKYKIRDSLIEYMNTLSANCSSKEEVIKIANAHIEDFKQIAENTIKNQGYSYSAQVEIGNFEFPTKNYGDVSFPAGYYDALRVKIGKAKGQNWWCVMFPPLCFVDVTTGIVPEESKQELESNLNEEEYQIVSDNESPDIKFKFKLIEFFEQRGLITAKK